MKKGIVCLTTLLFLLASLTTVSAQQIHQETINDRTFYWIRPDSDPPEEGYPVLFMLHGALEQADWYVNSPRLFYSGQRYFIQQALKEGYLIVVPESGYIQSSIPVKAWDAFTKGTDNNSDLQFLKNITTWLQTSCEEHTNPHNQHCLGFSSGGFMASRIGHDQPTLFKSLSIYAAGDANGFDYNGGRPTFNLSANTTYPDNHPPTLIITGLFDPIVPIIVSRHLYKGLQEAHIETQLEARILGTHLWSPFTTDTILSFIQSH